MADASKRSAQVKKKQMLLLGGIGAVLVALSVGASMMMTPVASKSSPSTQPKTRPLVLGATGAEKESWRAQSSGTISDMERRLNMLESTSKERAREAEDAKTKQRELQTELDRLKTGGGVPPPVQMTDPGNAGVFQQEGLGTPPPPPPALTGPGSMGSPLAPPPTMSRISSVSISDAENNVEADPTTAGEAIGQAIAGDGLHRRPRHPEHRAAQHRHQQARQADIHHDVARLRRQALRRKQRPPDGGGGNRQRSVRQAKAQQA